MTTSFRGYWRQSGLCFLTFVIGIAVAMAWQNVWHEAGISNGVPQVPAATAPAAPSEHWNIILTLIVMAALAAIVLAVGFRLAAEQRSTSASSTTASDSRHATLVATPISAGPEDIEHVRDHVDRQLAELVGYVSRYLDTTSDQETVFSTAQTNLAGASTVEQVQEVIKLLIANNATARQNADELRARLVEAKSESAQLQASLHKAETLATVDGLTNLPNRRRFQDSLSEHVAACHREHTPLCLVMADLDHFKAVNDKHGHLAGDAVLKTFATLLSRGIRSTDVAARYGGEEFALILPKTPLGSASSVAESLRRTVVETNWIGANSKQRIGRVTASFGVAEIREDETVDELIDRADQKLYEAKRKGRNRVELDHTVGTRAK